MRTHSVKQHIAATLHDLRKLEADGHLEHAPCYIMSVLEDLHDLQDASETFYQVMDNRQGNSVMVERLETLIAENLKPIEDHSLMLSIECHAVMLRLAADAVGNGRSLEEIAESVRAVRDMRLALLTSNGAHTETDEAKWTHTVVHARSLAPNSLTD